MRRQLNMAKSVGGDVFMPMASINCCQWGVCRWHGRKTRRLPIGPWWCPSLSRKDSFIFSLVI